MQLLWQSSVFFLQSGCSLLTGWLPSCMRLLMLILLLWVNQLLCMCLSQCTGYLSRNWNISATTMQSKFSTDIFGEILGQENTFRILRNFGTSRRPDHSRMPQDVLNLGIHPSTISSYRVKQTHSKLEAQLSTHLLVTWPFELKSLSHTRVPQGQHVCQIWCI